MGYLNKVIEVIERSDVVLEVLDARFVDKTRNTKFEDRVIEKGKILIHVINKCDLVSKEECMKIKKMFENCVFVSAKEHYGTLILKEKIMILSKQKGITEPKVSVIGYPNVGKSSIINAFSGTASAGTSPYAGYTKGKQNIRISKNIVMIDTPGVIAPDDYDHEKLVAVGAKNPHSSKDPDFAVMKIMDEYPGRIEEFYGLEKKKYSDDGEKEDAIKAVALKLNMKMKGNLPDLKRASLRILKDWGSGKIKIS